MIPRSAATILVNSSTVLNRLLKIQPVVTQSQRTVLLRPEYWYFIDTEGNLQSTKRRVRYLDQPPVEEQIAATFSLANVEKLLQEMQGDLPLEAMPNPYKKERERCILCKYNIELDYKNARLISQFVSRYTGLIYERQTTGLCRMQDEKLRHCHKEACIAGYMPRSLGVTEPVFLHDPKLFDPFVPKRKS
ncbi:uncharacterized protein LOC129588416 [Paramacrobiotus metropolitanus]|uniref:uncharacterized protein LOC129588416 n=1 Tax=Paramacrobiotus metropolitanus TaxID=2943436 RepID=UPI00244636A2|nr:uncharacterized protein LOC129588416 [Paramacrobiotus metropolitanus]